jgi:hypothetical protein
MFVKLNRPTYETIIFLSNDDNLEYNEKCHGITFSNEVTKTKQNMPIQSQLF